MSMFEIVFSPTGGTEKVSGLVTGALDGNIVTVDLSDSGLDFHGVSMAKGDVAVISVPSYAGRVPAVAVERLGMVRGNGARAVAAPVLVFFSPPVRPDRLLHIWRPQRRPPPL